ncbi:MAG: hypothetical protein RI637_04125 [Acidimicrobiia bacterium]|nr:hypothetical protein [Acidimicrobiia bacterium]
MPAIQPRLRVPAILMVTLVVIGTGCAETSTEPNTAAPLSPGRVELPYNPDPPQEARIIANLAGDPQLDGGCVWLRQGTTDFSVLWPEGFTADFNPLRLYDGNGDLVAQEGEALELTGSFAVDAAAYRPHRCIVGSELWLAGRVGSSD